MNPNSAGTSNSRINDHRESSLYVTGLHPDTDEMALFEKFSTVGPVDSIRMVREMITFRPLGSAYVNFQRSQDAERAFQTLNGDDQIQITWPEVDTCTPHVLAGIFVKHLDETMDNQAVCDMFSTVGNVLRCKVALDLHGGPKGYAFVYFYATSSARNAIDKVNGLLVNGSELSVGPMFTSLHVKNFGDRLTQASLQELFAPYGSIKTHGVVKGKNGQSRGCGYVAYDSPEAAGHAMEALNGKELGDGKVLRVVPSHKNLHSAPTLTHQGPTELFIRNLDASVDNRQLGEIFAPYGRLERGFVVMEKGSRKSKGFGFVTYASGEEAARAILEMNDREVAGKRIFVAISKGKEAKAAAVPVESVEPDNEPAIDDDDDDLRAATAKLKSLLGRRLYPLIKECVDQGIAGRITNQLMEQHNPADLTELLKNPKQLQTAARNISSGDFLAVMNVRLQLKLLTAVPNRAAA